MRPAILPTRLDLIQFLRLLIITEKVDAVIHAPEFACLGMPGKADGVAEAFGENRAALAVGAGPQQRGILLIAFVAAITRGADAYIKHVVRAEGDGAVGCWPESGRSLMIICSGSSWPSGRITPTNISFTVMR